MAYTEWYQGYLRQEQEEALRRERGASRQHATFAQRPPAQRPAPPPRTPTVQEQLAACLWRFTRHVDQWQIVMEVPMLKRCWHNRSD